MIACVELPAGKLIDCHDLAWAVARYRFPFPEEGATGMSCITGSKMVDYSRPAIPSVRPIEKPRTRLAPPVEQFDPPPYAKGGQPLDRPELLTDLWLPVKLTEQDKVLLAAILDELPPLKYPMSELEQQRFLAAFREKIDSLQLVGQRRWEPILATEAYVDKQRRDRIQFFAENGMVALGEEFARGQLDIVNRSGNPALTFDAKLDVGHYFLDRREVICILDRLGIPYIDGDLSSNQDGGRMPRNAEFDGGEEEGGKEWTLERVRKMHADYMSSGNDAKTVANRHELSLAMMYRRFDEYELRKKTNSGRKPKEKSKIKKSATSSTSLDGIMSKWGKPVL